MPGLFVFNNKILRQGVLIMLNNRIKFQCNICGSKSILNIKDFSREQGICINCGSSVRMRSIIHLLSLELFGESLTLQEFPFRKDIIGIGMSDKDEYAVPLSKKLGYINTYYHKEPRLDIAHIDEYKELKYDFIISSDVFEHVVPPIENAFQNVIKLLKPNGVFIFSVPYTKKGKTIEWFPDLYNYEIINIDSKFKLKNITKDGREQQFDDLIFHGGPGEVLEMRVFCEKDLLNNLKKSGFTKIKIMKKNYLKFGIKWNCNWSLPLTASKI